MSLHSLGGEIRKEREPSSFVFRDRGVLLQYQAWWQPDAPELDDRCIAWVENVRDTMKPHTDGAFINFVDATIPLGDYYTSTGRQDAMPFLRKVKKDWSESLLDGANQLMHNRNSSAAARASAFRATRRVSVKKERCIARRRGVIPSARSQPAAMFFRARRAPRTTGRALSTRRHASERRVWNRLAGPHHCREESA
ncbi:MAG TPA: hypothetical protein VKE51_43070 [Vicinamibacterales bacterium]|nr:hypothetical protein [Vicinamibacterales bacterium]